MVIMLNCILGIIIDNFGILRDQLKSYILDKENLCFICGLSKEYLEKNSDVAHQGFLHHIKVYNVFLCKVVNICLNKV